jgi:glucose/arabinose dehydrogenase
MGDGGAADDRFGHGQRSDTLLGSMLRIRVGPGIDGYEIPDGNVFAAGGGAPEVWAIGLRNPWRWAFGPPVTVGPPLLYVADVGQGRVEEVTVVGTEATGVNFGWPITEGSECFQAASCDAAGLVLPQTAFGSLPAAGGTEYSHADGCSITGGFVYEGDAIPALRGHFLYGDYCAGWINSLRLVGDPGDDTISQTEHELFPPRTVPDLTSFGRDGFGELYVLVRQGRVFKLVAA